MKYIHEKKNANKFVHVSFLVKIVDTHSINERTNETRGNDSFLCANSDSMPIDFNAGDRVAIKCRRSADSQLFVLGYGQTSIDCT